MGKKEVGKMVNFRMEWNYDRDFKSETTKRDKLKMDFGEKISGGKEGNMKSDRESFFEERDGKIHGIKRRK